MSLQHLPSPGDRTKCPINVRNILLCIHSGTIKSPLLRACAPNPSFLSCLRPGPTPETLHCLTAALWPIHKMTQKSRFDRSRTRKCIRESLSQLDSLKGEAVDLESEFWKQACNARQRWRARDLAGKAFSFQACMLCLKPEMKASFSSPLKLEEICPSVPPSTVK